MCEVMENSHAAITAKFARKIARPENYQACPTPAAMGYEVITGQ
jgi:hypothetical protein